MSFELRRVGAQHAVGIVDRQRALVLPLQDADSRYRIAHRKSFGQWQRVLREWGDVVQSVAHGDRCETEPGHPIVRIRGDELLQPTDCFLVVAVFEVL